MANLPQSILVTVERFAESMNLPPEPNRDGSYTFEFESTGRPHLHTCPGSQRPCAADESQPADVGPRPSKPAQLLARGGLRPCSGPDDPCRHDARFLALSHWTTLDGVSF